MLKAKTGQAGRGQSEHHELKPHTHRPVRMRVLPPLIDRSAFNGASVRGLIAALFVLATACREAITSRGSESPSLTLVDSVILKQSDSAFVGRPTGFKIARDGSYLISDWRNDAVFRFAANGSYVRSYGERGSGRGQFLAVTENSPGGDSLLFAAGGLNLEVFNLRTGTEEWERQLPLNPSTLGGSPRGVYFGYVNSRTRSTVAFVDGDSSKLAYGGPFPALLGVSKYVDGPFSKETVAWIAPPDTIALAIQSSDFLYVGPFRGPFDSVRVAVVQRRGSRPDLLRKVRDDNSAFARSVLFKTSSPWGLARITDSTYAYAALDDSILEMERTFAGRAFLSVVDFRNHRSCSDAIVPATHAPVPYLAFRGDTLFVLDEYVVGRQPMAVIRKYTISTRECSWTGGQSAPTIAEVQSHPSQSIR